MIRYRPYEAGDVFGQLYVFDGGDKLKTHTHEREMAHNCIVLDGAVTVNGVLHGAGTVVDIEWGQPHEIVACGPAKTLHLYLFGKPEQYKRLTREELSGTF